MSEQEKPIKKQEIILNEGDRITIQDKKGEVGKVEVLNVNPKRQYTRLEISDMTNQPIVRLDKEGKVQIPKAPQSPPEKKQD